MEREKNMDKRILVLLGMLIIAGGATALTLFNDTVEVWNSASRGFCVVENYLSPKDHFCVDTTPGGHVKTTTIEPIGSPNPTIGTPTNPYSKAYVGEYVGQKQWLVAGNGVTCDQMCQSQSLVCQSSIWADLTPSNCSDSGRLKNCLCK